MQSIAAGTPFSAEFEIAGPGGPTWRAFTAPAVLRGCILVMTEDVTERNRPRRRPSGKRGSGSGSRRSARGSGSGTGTRPRDRVTISPGFLRRPGLEEDSIAGTRTGSGSIHPDDREPWSRPLRREPSPPARRCTSSSGSIAPSGEDAVDPVQGAGGHGRGRAPRPGDRGAHRRDGPQAGRGGPARSGSRPCRASSGRPGRHRHGLAPADHHGQRPALPHDRVCPGATGRAGRTPALPDDEAYGTSGGRSTRRSWRTGRAPSRRSGGRRTAPSGTSCSIPSPVDLSRPVRGRRLQRPRHHPAP